MATANSLEFSCGPSGPAEDCTMSRLDEIAKLKKKIESCAVRDHYIDEDEEAGIFQFGKKLGFDNAGIESVLNQMCRDNQWTREVDIIPDLRDELAVLTRQQGGVEKKQFEHCVNFAISMNMPRKRATHLGVKFVVDNGLKIRKGWFESDWFAPLRQQSLSK